MSERQITRRAVTRAAAWSVPVVAVAAAAPATAASDGRAPIISGACVDGLSIPTENGTITVGQAQFTITAGSVDLADGSTFLLTGDHLDDVSLDQSDKIDVSATADGKVVTLTAPVTKGSSLVLTASSLYMEKTDPDLTLAAAVLNGGSITGAVSATVDMTPASVDLGGFSQWFGVCDASDADRNRRIASSLTTSEKARVAGRFRRARLR